MIARNPVPARENAVLSMARRLSRRRRRLLVAATAAGYPGIFVWARVVDGHAPMLLNAVASGILLAMTIVGGSLIWMWTRNRVDLKASLDERERQVRDQVYVRSYQLLGVVISFFVVVAGLMTAFGSPITLDFEALTPFIVGNAIYFPSLPSLVYAWTEPDPLPEDA